MKDDKEVISEFNEYVNMTASELEKWLKSDDSNSAGWPKAGEGGGESVGHDSGRKIVEILKSNPDKEPDKYTDEQLQHMRKVASYCKRHLAQESAGNKNKDPDDVKETKSYISLKNWGHDFLKAQGNDAGTAKNGGNKSASKEKEDQVEEDAEGEDDVEEQEDGDEEGKDDDKKTGDKRKKSGQQNGSNKKRETHKTRSTKNESENEQDAEEDLEDEGDDGGDENEENGGSEEASSKNGPEKGQTVSWNWGNGKPSGKVLDVKEEKYVFHWDLQTITVASRLTIEQGDHHDKAR